MNINIICRKHKLRIITARMKMRKGERDGGKEESGKRKEIK